ncbi:hypothetical protein COU80_00660 [Candidatus Peregrinibacteria bacterium CG10_big_fil_rev_8_21_14_0_10_55_24]|nr:MAG: hypothetical protein COU80_00660 [Candidatus Peregrinibacteria bacterium CG10_big_fil_rev_8_21_14_0_10_55_24]
MTAAIPNDADSKLQDLGKIQCTELCEGTEDPSGREQLETLRQLAKQSRDTVVQMNTLLRNNMLGYQGLHPRTGFALRDIARGMDPDEAFDKAMDTMWAGAPIEEEKK